MNTIANRHATILLVALAAALILIIPASAQPLAVTNLSFQADISGSSSPETLEYLSDLHFYSWGGFGVNAHIFRARIQSSGDEIAYAVSADTPNAFTLNATIDPNTPVTLTITTAEYSAGTVTMPTPSELHFVWEVQESGLHVKLHRKATLVPNPNVTVGNVISESFTIENLGQPFVLDKFSEYLHLDDRARARDFDSDGRDETLLAINALTTSGYPVFGKIYLHRPNIRTDLISDGRFATVNHLVNLPFASGVEQEISKAAYVSSTARNGTEAELQVANDAKLLLTTEDRLLLGLPFHATSNSLSVIYSYFDHAYPTYESFPNDLVDAYRQITLYWGDKRGAGTADSCSISTESSAFCYDGHDGYDFGVTGTISATADGTVIYVGCDDESQNPPRGPFPCSARWGTDQQFRDGLGLMVTISHPYGYQTTYGHLLTSTLYAGNIITRGYAVGTAGSTGNSGGIHLHFLLTKNGKKIDPYGWIPGKVKVDPLTQPVTNTTTGEVFVGAPSSCLWELGCPTSKWVKPTDQAIVVSADSTVQLEIPSGAVAGITNFSIIPTLDTLASSVEAPAGYSFYARAWDTQSNSIVSFSKPLTLSVGYSDDATAFVRESTIRLFQWNESTTDWEPLTTSVDMVNNTAVVTLSSLSLFSLRGEPLYASPTVNAVNPNSVSTFASTAVTITGVGFQSGSRVWLGQTMLEPEYINPGTLGIVVPAYFPVGSHEIRVVNPDYQVARLTDAIEVMPPLRFYLPLVTKASASN